MTHPLTPREKVEREVLDAVFSGFEHGQCEKEWEPEYGKEIASLATDAILTALASGSGDHAELALNAKAAQTWALGIYENREQAARRSTFIDSDLPATVLALLAEIAALRGENEHVKKLRHQAIDRSRLWEIGAIKWETRATKAERKLAEAVQIMEPFARMADEEGGYREDDRLAWGLNRCDISWGDLRAVHTFLNKEAERG